MAIYEVQHPFGRALIPGLVKIKDDHDQLIGAYLKALGMLTLVAVPVALGFGWVAKEFIPIFLGGETNGFRLCHLLKAWFFTPCSLHCIRRPMIF